MSHLHRQSLDNPLDEHEDDEGDENYRNDEDDDEPTDMICIVKVFIILLDGPIIIKSALSRSIMAILYLKNVVI